MGVGTDSPLGPLYCCICFEPLTPEMCAVDRDGIKWDVCVWCAEEAGVDG